MLWRQVPKALADLLWPPRCVACDRPLGGAPREPSGRAFCAPCAETLAPSSSPRCVACGLPFTGAAADHLCATCLEARPPFRQARAPLLYGGALAAAISRFKYGPAPWLAGPLGRLLAADALGAAHADLVVPVPLHPRRLAARGFNQSALLAARVARARGLPLDTRGLVRVADTPPQAGLDRRARLDGLRGAFAVRPGWRGAGAAVLLVDDVVTTTATARAASAALLAAGARSVDVLALARSPVGGLVAPTGQTS